MRLRSLTLEKFGHFEEEQIDFGPGLTVVFGPNEAGKSTLLDGLGGFLWGVRNKNPRAFNYAPGAARLTGRVESGDVAVTLVRRLGKLTCDGVEQASLWGPAAVVSDEAWRRTFGMDRAGLRAGGRQLMAGGGDLADVIAMAETGEAISRLLEVLEARADAVFKERKNAACEIRTVNEKIRLLTQQISDHEASAFDVAALEARIASLGSRKAGLHQALNEARREQRRLEELQRCYAPANRLREARRAFEEARAEGAVVDRAGTELLREALEQAKRAVEQAGNTSDEIVREQERRARHAFSQAILDAATDIDGLREQLEARRSDRGIVDDAGKAARLLRDVEEVLRRLGSCDCADPLAVASTLMLGEQVSDQLDRYARDVIDAQRVFDDKTTAVGRREREVGEADSAEGDDQGERDVLMARQRRDDAWLQLRDPWVSGDLPGADSRQSMAEEVDEAIQNADEVAQSRGDALQKLAERKGVAAQLARQLRQAERDRDEAMAALTEKTDRWAGLVAKHALPAGLDPDGWQVHRQLLGELSRAVEDVRADGDDREQAQRRLTVFEQSIGRLAGLVPAADADPFVAVVKLAKTLDESRAAVQAVAEIDRRIVELQEQHENLTEQREMAERTIARLREGMDEPVDTVLARSQRRHDADDEVRRAEEILRQAKNPEGDLDAIAEAATTDRVALDSDALDAKRLVEEREAQHQGIAQELAVAQAELDRLTSRDSVAHLVAERVEYASQLRTLVEEYQSIRVQVELLRRYKQWLADNGDSTVLDHAGELLSVLTAGRFVGFVVVEEEGSRRIVVRHNDRGAGGEPTPMALSELSEGTADQVFLALRLAGIAVRQRQRVQDGLAMVPVVLDDVLMSHDDARAAAALQAMAGLGRQMQIIVLTHHRSVAEAAAGLADVQVSELRVPAVVR